MKQKNDGEKPHYLRLALAGVGILLLLALNYLYFREKTSSNSELITRYTRKADPMEKYRNPAVAGLFYAAAPQTLDREVSGYLQAAGGAYEKMPKMLIVPHAGYQYSAPAAARAYRPLRDQSGRIKTVILLGPSHRVPVNGLALSSADWFVTPLGKVPVDREMTAGLAARKGFRINDAAHRDEHSLEVQLPFLQKVLTDFEIVPIVYGAMNPQETAAKIKEVSPEIGYHQSCGAGGINSALILAQMMHLRPEILSLINSGDTAGSRERVVGYGAWVFAGTGGLERETAALADYAAVYKKDLLRIARTALEEAVLHGRVFEPSRDDYPDPLFDKGASFVTLEKNGELRGCIGSLLPRRATALDVAENAYNAALHDGRFAPVAAGELGEIGIAVSLLTGFEPVAYENEEDLLAKVNAGVDGLVIRDGSRQGLFLPSVWKQLPDKRDFLNNLKLKAGMSPSYWSNAIKVYRFRTVEIKENEN